MLLQNLQFIVVIMMKTKTLIKRYSDLKILKSFEERFEYLKMNSLVGGETFGRDRYLNQVLYSSPEWKRIRDQIILRDNGCDLGVEGYEIHGRILVHHLEPITVDDILSRDQKIFDPENLICVTHSTHNAIHYGNVNMIPHTIVTRKKHDTCPWKR